jgi:hypothetical protein
MMATPRCDVAHATNYMAGRPAVVDFGRYRRTMRGYVRYLCADCIRGMYLGKHPEKFRIKERLAMVKS